MLGFGDHQARQNFSVQAAKRGCGKHAFGSAADAHHSVDSGADDGRGNAGGEVSVANQADARAGGANVRDQFFMARPVEHNHNQIFDVAIEPLGDRAQIVGDGRIQVDCALAGRSNDYFFHVQIGRVKQAALFARGQHRDRARRSRGAQVRAFERIDRDIHGREIESTDVLRGADSFADEKHGRFVALALADDDGAVHGHFVHHLAHGSDGGLVGHVAVSSPHGFGRFDGRLFDDAQKFQTQLNFHQNSRSL